jgi:hypothetical protein
LNLEVLYITTMDRNFFERILSLADFLVLEVQANVVAHSAPCVILDSYISRNLEASSSPAHPR